MFDFNKLEEYKKSLETLGMEGCSIFPFRFQIIDEEGEEGYCLEKINLFTENEHIIFSENWEEFKIKVVDYFLNNEVK